ncbi:hypothetical protein [Paenibacillus harenae]|uniref:hypothetical protein n=1 Tax=Paenibacillus harenae TaxID=306543 RepID=UPI00049267DB|nr:hypothetical protein [Paenibacillus harenae]
MIRDNLCQLTNVRAACKDASIRMTGFAGWQAEIEFGFDDVTPDVTLHFGPLDLQAYQGLTIGVENLGAKPLKLYAMLNNNFWNHGFTAVAPGETGPLTVLFIRPRQSREMDGYFKGMNGLPDGSMVLWNPIDPSEIHSLRLYVMKPRESQAIRIHGISPYQLLQPLSKERLDNGYFPFIDEYGQFIHKDWPGKSESDADLIRRREQEALSLKTHPGAEEWSRYGGWLAGPRLDATGHFRVEKVDGKWWFIDPEGHLFWSHGVCCVRFDQKTAIEGREHYFRRIPEMQDFRMENLRRKYGEDWKNRSRSLAHARLRSWGLNTLANHSQEDIYDMRQTPYTIWLETRSWLKRKFPDVGNPIWRQQLRDRLHELGAKVNDDPWCLGVFVDNEIHGSTDPVLWETYFQLVSAAVKEAMPSKLYLGCRLDHHRYPHEGAEADAIVRLSAKYCDVVSFNFYKYSLKDFVWLDGAEDKPALIGEFHIGAPDRGLPHTGLKGAVDQEHRAEAYKEYVLSSLVNPHLIGTHWFQYSDQLYTGRFDGENYQIGFVDICDRPYPELVDACRSVGYGMYAYRYGAGD